VVTIGDDIFTDFLHTVNATCTLIYRLITDEMIANSVTLRLSNMDAKTFMGGTIYQLFVVALSEVLNLLPANIYIIDIQVGTIVIIMTV